VFATITQIRDAGRGHSKLDYPALNKKLRIITMTKSPAILLATIILFFQPLQSIRAAEDTTVGEAYKLQPGDVLDVSVWEEEDLQKQVLVRPDGGMSFPLVGNIQAAGKSVAELQKLITERLKKYIPDAVVTVATLKLDGNTVYVIGKVAKPGEFQVNRYVDVVQALSMAGGMTPYASDNKISILRRENGKQRSIPFRYGDIEKGEDLEQNIILQSGDVVVVP
jgi:polysaccharide export outer membrane protein